MSDYQIVAANGDTFTVEPDTEKPGVMLDFYMAYHDAGKLYHDLVAMGVQPTTVKPPVSDRIASGDATNYLILPAECVRALGERLIALADEHKAEWQEEDDDE